MQNYDRPGSLPEEYGSPIYNDFKNLMKPKLIGLYSRDNGSFIIVQ